MTVPTTRVRVGALLAMPVRDVAARWPAALPVLGRHGLDTCCGGTHPLGMALTAHGLGVAQILEELRAAGLETDEPEAG